MGLASFMNGKMDQRQLCTKYIFKCSIDRTTIIYNNIVYGSMIHSYVKCGSCDKTDHRRQVDAYKYHRFWLCHPVAIRWKWFLVLSTLLLCAGSIVVIFYIPTMTRISTTTNMKTRYNNIDDNLQSKKKKTKSSVITFHLAFTAPKFTKLNQRCIESIFYFHPTARLIIHSNMENGIHTIAAEKAQVLLKPIQQLIDLGYHIEIIPYNAADILNRAMTMPNSIVNTTFAKVWMSKISTQYSQEKYWYSNESNLLRLCLLYVDGGIYLDTDVILVRPMVVVDDEPTSNNDNMNGNSNNNTVTDNHGLDVDNVMARDGNSFECAVMKFVTPGNLFLGHAINNFIRHYNGVDWGNNGPRVFGRTSKEMPHLLCPEPYNYTTTTVTTVASPKSTNTINPPLPCSMQPLPCESFQPVPWRTWLTYCFDTKKSPVGRNATMIVSRPNVYAVHMNNHIFGTEIEKHIYVKNSICDIVLTKFCILCT